MAFQYDKDILCQVEYEDANLPAGTDKLIAVYNVTGIADFSSEAAAKGIATLPKVSSHVATVRYLSLEMLIFVCVWSVRSTSVSVWTQVDSCTWRRRR